MCRILFLFTIFFCVSISNATADTTPNNSDLTEAIDLVLKERRELIVEKIQLNESEKARFWPEYDKFEKEMRVVIGDLTDLMKKLATESETMSAEDAEAVIDKLFATKNSSIDIQEEYIQKFRSILPPEKLGIFITILFLL